MRAYTHMHAHLRTYIYRRFHRVNRARPCQARPDQAQAVYIYKLTTVLSSNLALTRARICFAEGKNPFNEGKAWKKQVGQRKKQASKSYVVEVDVQLMVHALEAGAEIVFHHRSNTGDAKPNQERVRPSQTQEGDYGPAAGPVSSAEGCRAACDGTEAQEA